MTSVALPPVFDLSAATDFVETLRAASGSLVLDGANVERIGVAGLQVLLSAHASARAAGHRFAIERPSGALQAAAHTAGANLLLASDR